MLASLRTRLFFKLGMNRLGIPTIIFKLLIIKPGKAQHGYRHMKINHTPATAERCGRWPITQFPIIPAPCAAQFPLPCPLHMLFITGNVSDRSTTNKIPSHAVSCQVMLCLQPIHHTGTSCSMLYNIDNGECSGCSGGACRCVYSHKTYLQVMHRGTSVRTT